MINPTVGRVVHYHPHSNQAQADFAPTQVCAALIAFVHSDTLVNLAVFDANGALQQRTHVPLIHDEENEQLPEDGNYATWMPYQKTVAAGEIPAVQHAS